MEVVCEILECVIVEAETASEMVYGDILRDFIPNGDVRFERNVMITPAVFNSESMAASADMSTPEGVAFMEAMSIARKAFGGK